MDFHLLILQPQSRDLHIKLVVSRVARGGVPRRHVQVDGLNSNAMASTSAGRCSDL